MGSYYICRFEYIDLDACAETIGKCSQLRCSWSQRESKCKSAQTARIMDRSETIAKISNYTNNAFSTKKEKSSC